MLIFISLLFLLVYLIKDIIKYLGFDFGLVNTEYSTVIVTIKDTYSRGVRTILIPSTNNMYIPITRPPVYKIYVTYENKEYVIYGEKIYNYYKNKIGYAVNGKLEIRTYKNGTKKYNIVNIEPFSENK